MRTRLEKYEGQRIRVRATFVCCTIRGKMLLKDISILNETNPADGEYLTDHMWLDYTRTFQKLLLRKGDAVKFTTRVVVYTKGHERRLKSTDYKFEKMQSARVLWVRI